MLAVTSKEGVHTFEELSKLVQGGLDKGLKLPYAFKMEGNVLKVRIPVEYYTRKKDKVWERAGYTGTKEELQELRGVIDSSIQVGCIYSKDTTQGDYTLTIQVIRRGTQERLGNIVIPFRLNPVGRVKYHNKPRKRVLNNRVIDIIIKGVK